MKNQVNKEELELGKRMREHEFSFDPSALAGFESLLAAEDAVAGKAARVAPPMADGGSRFRKLLTGLLALLLVAGVSLAGWHWFGQEAPVVDVELPATTTATPAVADHQEPEGVAPAEVRQDPAPLVPDPAPAPRRPNGAAATTLSTPTTTFIPVPQPTTLVRRPLPMPRTGTEGQAPPRPQPISGYATEKPAHSRVFTVRPLTSTTYQLTYSRALPEVRLERVNKDDWRP